MLNAGTSNYPDLKGFAHRAAGMQKSPGMNGDGEAMRERGAYMGPNECRICGAKANGKRICKACYKQSLKISVIIRRKSADTETRLTSSVKTGKVVQRIVVRKSTGEVLERADVQKQEQEKREREKREKTNAIWFCQEASLAGISHSSRAIIKTGPCDEKTARAYFRYALARESLGGCSVWSMPVETEKVNAE